MKNRVITTATHHSQVGRHTAQPINVKAPKPTAASIYHLIAGTLVGKQASYKHNHKIYTGTIVGITTNGEALIDILRPHHETRQFVVNFKDCMIALEATPVSTQLSKTHR